MMNWLDRMEKKLGRYAIRGLMTYIVVLNLAVYLLNFIDTRGVLTGMLVLDPYLVMRGEVWRLVTYIFIPPQSSILFIIFVLYFYYIVGAGLEQEWGSFKFNVYYLIGMTGTILAAFISGGGASAIYLNMSLFLAFAQIYPDYEILLFMIVPVKVKYLAWLDWIFIVFTIVTANYWDKAAALASVVNFFIFFGKDIVTGIRTGSQAQRRRRAYDHNIPRNLTIHRCTVCGITEKDDLRMEFRYCSGCEGDYEYCMEHLKNHEHKKGETESG